MYNFKEDFKEITKNDLFTLRNKGKNKNAIIIGNSNSGVGFISKYEILRILYNTEDEIICIDSHGNLNALAKLFNGNIIKLSNLSLYEINPFNLSKENDLLNGKIDFMISIFEVLCNRKLTKEEKTLIKDCINKLYKEKKKVTFGDFYNYLIKKDEKESRYFAEIIKPFIITPNDFPKKNKINTNSRLTVINFDSRMSAIIAFNIAANKSMINYKNKKNTWILVDDICNFANDNILNENIKKVWEKSSIYNLFITGITRDPRSFYSLKNNNIFIKNSSSLCLLNHSKTEIDEISNLFNLTKEESKKVLNAKPGTGIIVQNDKKTFIDITNIKGTDAYMFITYPEEFIKR